jgi:hypothetical protein
LHVTVRAPARNRRSATAARLRSSDFFAQKVWTTRGLVDVFARLPDAVDARPLLTSAFDGAAAGRPRHPAE